jgi:hypothetical protein
MRGLCTPILPYWWVPNVPVHAFTLVQKPALQCIGWVIAPRVQLVARGAVLGGNLCALPASGACQRASGACSAASTTSPHAALASPPSSFSTAWFIFPCSALMPPPPRVIPLCSGRRGRGGAIGRRCVQQNMPGVLPLRGRHPRRPMRDFRAAAVLRLGLLVLATAIAFIDGLHWTAVTGAVTVPAIARPAGSTAAVSSCRFGAIAAKRMFTLSSRPEDEARRVTRMVGSLGATGAAVLPRAWVAGVTVDAAEQSEQSRAARAPPVPAMCVLPFGTFAIAPYGSSRQTVALALAQAAAAAVFMLLLQGGTVANLNGVSIRLHHAGSPTDVATATRSPNPSPRATMTRTAATVATVIQGAQDCWLGHRAAGHPPQGRQELQQLAPISLACTDVRWGPTSLLVAGPGLGDSTALNAVEVCIRSRPGWDRVGPVGLSGAQGCLSVGRRAPLHRLRRLGMALPHQASPACGRLMAFLEVGLLSSPAVVRVVNCALVRGRGEVAVTCRRAAAVYLPDW